jgi:aldehyde dehydrogenase (NAD+)
LLDSNDVRLKEKPFEFKRVNNIQTAINLESRLMLDRRKFYINGQWVSPAITNDLEVINPSNEEPCAVISLGSQADTDAAVAAANAAFESWSQTPKSERLALIEKLAEVYKARGKDMAEAISLEMGAPVALANGGQVGSGSWHIANFIRAFKNFEFDRMLGDHAPNDRILYEPVGVCGLITPWNWPMNQVTLKAIPAMAVGCTTVLKPSEIAPLSSIVFAEMVDEAGFPAGVFNLVNGDGPGVGSQLSGHQDVDMISFTGSARAGMAISKNAADTIKRVSLELGGKGANVIFADADENAVKRGTQHCFGNSGQSCNAPTRMLVERPIYDDAVKIAVQTAEKTAVDIASKEGRHIGPVVSQIQFDKIQGLIEKGIEEGARLVAGGTGRPQGLNRGYFVRPTVFADVSNDMTIAREEIFGPVLSIIPFDSEEDAVDIANDTDYGLTNYVQTQDGTRANRMARRLRSGMVEMNGTSRSAGAPFGGYKQSGNGREGGVWGLEEFLEVKSVSGWAPE